MPELATSLLLALAALAAGFVDAVAGGGGLIMVPALLVGLPEMPVAVLLGTNKATSVMGTSVAAWRYRRSGLLPAGLMAAPVVGVCGGFLGAQLAVHLPSAAIRPIMLGLLAAMLLFVTLRPELGQEHAPQPGRQWPVAMLSALVIGCYDGFFGPGTGVLLVFVFVTVIGFDFLRASALAKAINFGSNVGAAMVLVGGGHWRPKLALVLIGANIVGGYLGAHMAIAGGSRLVRRIFTLVVAALLIRLAWQI
jgi:uncharacterized protein